jgi:hypothetical protein
MVTEAEIEKIKSNRLAKALGEYVNIVIVSWKNFNRN